MSLITRCPACGTMFKVVTDQLKVSQGWVRCGHCADVFDASQHLQIPQTPSALYSAPPSPQAESAWQSPPDPAHSVFDPGQWQQDQRAVLLDESGTLRLDAHGQAVRVAPVNSQVASEPLQAPMPVAELPASEPLERLRPPDNFDSSSMPVAPELPGARLAGISEAPDIPALTDLPLVSDEVSFVKDARRQARWRQPAVRIGLGFLSLLLALLLLLQVVVQQRDDVAAREPSLKPWLQMLCVQLQCRVDAPRSIEAVVIESSAFNKVNADTYRLSFTIKNTSAVAVAMPSLEVTLTDTRDQALVRRVLSPAQLGETRSALLAGAESSGLVFMQVLAVTVPAAAPASGASIAPGNFSPTAVAGYRLLAFYP